MFCKNCLQRKYHLAEAKCFWTTEESEKAEIKIEKPPFSEHYQQINLQGRVFCWNKLPKDFCKENLQVLRSLFPLIYKFCNLYRVLQNVFFATLAQQFLNCCYCVCVCVCVAVVCWQLVVHTSSQLIFSGSVTWGWCLVMSEGGSTYTMEVLFSYGCVRWVVINVYFLHWVMVRSSESHDFYSDWVNFNSLQY